MNHSRNKKISRTYRISPITDTLLKKVSQITGESQGGIIDRLAAYRTHEFIVEHLLIERFASAEISDLAELIRASRNDMVAAWIEDLSLRKRLKVATKVATKTKSS